MSIQKDRKRIYEGNGKGSPAALRSTPALASESRASLFPTDGIISLENAAGILKSLIVKQNLQYLVLAAITLFAGLLRFYNLGNWSFWYDEIYTLRSIGILPGTSFAGISVSRALIYLVLSTFGTNEWFARLVPAIIGALTVPILYFPIKNLFNSSVGLIASFLLAVSTWHLYWSQNARFYTTLLLFYTLALLAFYYGIEKDKPLYLIFFLLLTGLAVREREFAVFVVPIAVIYLVCLKVLPFEKPRGLNTRNLVILAAPSVVFGSILGWSFIQDLPNYLEGFGTVNTQPWWILSGVIYYIGMPVVFMGATGAWYGLFRNRDRAVLLLSVSALFPLLVVMGLSFVQYSANRYIFISLTSWIILAGLAFHELRSNVQGFAQVFVAGVLLVMVFEPLGEDILYYQFQNGNRDDWKAAFELIKDNIEQGDKVVVTEPLLGNYYLPGKAIGIEQVDMDTLTAGESRVWFVEDNNLGNKYPRKQRWIEEYARLIDNFDVAVRARVFKMRVYRYDP